MPILSKSRNFFCSRWSPAVGSVRRNRGERPRLQIFLRRKVAADTRAPMNWLAIIFAAVAYWILGWLWYSALFGKIWVAGLEQRGVKLEKGGMAPKMIGTFIANLVAAVIMMRLIARTGIVDLAHGLKLGAGVGGGFSVTTISSPSVGASQP